MSAVHRVLCALAFTILALEKPTEHARLLLFLLLVVLDLVREPILLQTFEAGAALAGACSRCTRVVAKQVGSEGDFACLGIFVFEERVCVAERAIPRDFGVQRVDRPHLRYLFHGHRFV